MRCAAEKLAVLDEASLTGTGQSSADLLGVSAAVLAEKLGGHLVREIMIRGSRGGPLTPLASQLNHDEGHLRGQRLEGILAQLADAVRAGRDTAVVSQAMRLLPRPVSCAAGRNYLRTWMSGSRAAPRTGRV
jgi:hypothetical protein